VGVGIGIGVSAYSAVCELAWLSPRPIKLGMSIRALKKPTTAINSMIKLNIILFFLKIAYVPTTAIIAHKLITSDAQFMIPLLTSVFYWNMRYSQLVRV